MLSARNSRQTVFEVSCQRHLQLDMLFRRLCLS